MPLDRTIASVPGMAGYYGMQQLNDERMNQQVGRLSRFSTLQQHFQDLERERTFREGFKPGMSDDDIVALAARSAPAKDTLHYLQQSKDRAEQSKSRLFEIILRGQQRQDDIERAAREHRITREEADRRSLENHKQLQSLLFSFQGGQREADRISREFIAGQDRFTATPSGHVLNRATGEVTTPTVLGAPGGMGPGAPGPLSKVNPLPVPERSRLENVGGELQNLISLAKGFKPGYTNTLGPQVGELENIARRYLPGLSPEQANWWALYRRLSEVPERHKAFGTALTGREGAKWAALEANPGWKPNDIIRSLNIRAALSHMAIGRQMKSLSQRYHPTEVTGAAGVSMPEDQGLNQFPSDDDLAARGARLTGLGRPPLEELLK